MGRRSLPGACAALLLIVGAAACDSRAAVNASASQPPVAEAGQVAATDPVYCTVQVQREYPHDPAAFTQGLLYEGGQLFESTGLVGQSTIRRVRLSDGQVVQQSDVPTPYFGEGMTKWKNELISLTWQDGKGFRWDAKTLQKRGEFSYSGEGWGLTHDGKRLILSDGTPVLRFLDPSTMKVERTLTVTAGGQPVPYLNELEWVKGELLANVWLTDQIVKIDPVSGVVRSVIDLAGLKQRAGAQGSDAVLNGIAYDAGEDRLFVTGKKWSRLFQIALRGC